MYVVSKPILAQIPSFVVLFFRYVLTSIVLLFLLRRGKAAKERVKIERKDYKTILFIGFFGYFFSIGAQLLGTQMASASLASLINALNPIFMIVFAIPILHEKVTVQKVVSIVAALVGVYIIIGGASGDNTLPGIVFSFLSVVSWSLMSVTVRRVTQKYDPLTITTYGILVATVCALPVSTIELVETPHAVAALLQPAVIAGLAYMAIVCTALAHLLWNKSLSMLEAGRCSLFYPLQPVTAALLGSIFLHETLHVSFIVGAILILGGVVFSLLPVRFALRLHSSPV